MHISIGVERFDLPVLEPHVICATKKQQGGKKSMKICIEKCDADRTQYGCKKCTQRSYMRFELWKTKPECPP